jgi:hypothetical protein
MVHSRLFTAQYLLLKNGALGKWPVVEMSDEGVVLSVELHPEGLKERPGLQLHGGLLMAGLVDAGPFDSSLHYTQRLLNRHFSSGTLYLGTDSTDLTLYSPPILVKRPELTTCPLPFLHRNAKNFQAPLMERIRQYCSLDSKQNWLELIGASVAWIAAQDDNLKNVGSVEPGQKSGLMVLQNLDLNKMEMTESMRIKWLSVPSQK